MDDEIWFQKGLSFEAADEADREFWAEMTPEERVSVVEQMRMEGITDGDEQRLQRVFRIFKRQQR